MMFKEMDTNGDGVISRAEFDAFYNRRFKQLDANGDGMITADEMRAAHDRMMENDEGRLEEHFRDADADHDGALSRDEAVNMPMLSRHFDDVDANKDGKVTLDELRDYIRKMHGNGDGRRGKPPKAE
jgi:Ca2+-binding EF-hand superfamily protein